MTRKNILMSTAVVALTIGTLSGCSSHKSSATTKWETPTKTHKKVSKKVKKAQLSVVTDSGGDVVQIAFVKKSGSSAVDDYIVQSIKDTWPGQAPANSRIVVEVAHSAAKGFSEPKLLSIIPLEESATPTQVADEINQRR